MWWGRQVIQRLDANTTAVNTLTQKVTHMSAELDALSAQVAANTTVELSAITLINGLVAQIAAAGTDPVALAKLTADLKASADALAADVAANTHTAPAPAPVPAP